MLLKYKIEKTELIDALTDIEEFETSMAAFMKRYPFYKYKLKLTNPIIGKTDKWGVELTIKRDERANNKDIT